ncbi:hypothetical protein [Terriglobus tenax]|uniref:hypothetical protein n=1 Tax=Terriglobus tenax TaxID=1111115 RepID=UPI0021E0A2F0|nr:hypothetical protein [Terriglobus tenax]
MSIVPTPSGEIPEPEKTRGLGFYFALFGAGLLISFGLCGISAKLYPNDYVSALGLFSFILGLCCVLGLLGTLFAALVNLLRKWFS